MSDVLPTFRSNKDRLVYLLAEYKYPISAVAVAAGVWAAVFVKQVPTPPQSWLDFSLAWAVLAFPMYLFGVKVAGWLYTRDWVTVGVVDGSDELPLARSVRVPPETWHQRTETGASALETSDGNLDYLVQKFEFYEDVGELEVRGFERADMDPDQQFSSAQKVAEYYEFHHVVRRMYTNLKERVHDKISDVHDATMMNVIQQRERGEVDLDVQVTDLIDEMEDSLDDLPDGPSRDTRPEPQRVHDVDSIDDLGDIGLDESPGRRERPAAGRDRRRDP